MSDIQDVVDLNRTFTKVAAAVKDYGFDLAPTRPWKPWLDPDEIVTALAVTADAGLTVGETSINANSRGVISSLLVAWLSGGTSGQSYDVRYQFSTNKGRTDVFTLTINVI